MTGTDTGAEKIRGNLEKVPGTGLTGPFPSLLWHGCNSALRHYDMRAKETNSVTCLLRSIT
jgi:hypothetical protein